MKTQMLRRGSFVIATIVYGAVLLVAITPTFAEGVTRLECFPIERMAPELRAKAEALLLETMDSSALYTIVGGLKPMTSNFLNSREKGGADLSNRGVAGRQRASSGHR